MALPDVIEGIIRRLNAHASRHQDGGADEMSLTGLDGTLALVLVVVSKTANYTALSTDCIILCDASGGAFTITLPALSAVDDGKVYHIKKIDSSSLAVTVDADGSEKIDGATTQIISDQYTSLYLVKSSSEWGIH